MVECEQHVGQFWRHLAWWFVVRRAVAAVTLWIFIWGTAVLVLRTAFATSSVHLLWGVLGIPTAIAAAVMSVHHRLPNRDSVRALLDCHSDCGGLLMAGPERDVAAWQRRMPTVELPRVRWRATRPLGLLAVSLGYILVGFLLPARLTNMVHAASLDVSRDVERLGDQVRVLKEEKILEPERADAIQKELEQVRQQSAANDPAKTLEALDHLSDMVRQAARKAAETTARQSDMLGQVEAAAEALKSAGKDLKEEDATELQEELARLTRKAASENAQLQKDLEDKLASENQRNKLSSSDLSKLAKEARKGKSQLGELAKKLYDSKLIDARQLKECEGKGACDPEKLAEFLKKNGAKHGLSQAMGQCAGRGGVNEGPGTNGLQFTDPSDKDGVKFREEALPPPALAALKESQIIGIAGSAPQQDPKSEALTAGSLSGAAAGGGSANTPVVLPQHRASVGRYFDRPSK